MANVQLPRGYRGLDDLPKQHESLINLVNVGGSVVRTPGVDSLIESAGDGCRGAATWFVDGSPYYVLGDTLYRLESDETLTDLGTIGGTADCILVGGQVEMVICVVGGPSYTYATGPGLQQIVDPNFLPSKSVDFIDGRFVFVPADGSPAFYTDVDDASTIGALSFFDAEELPDINESVINVRNLLFLQGSQGTEVFTSTSDADAPFARRNGSRVDYGYVSGMIRYKNTFAFIGKQREQSFGIYIMRTGECEEISAGIVSEDLNDNYTRDQIVACRANRFKWFGLEFIAFSFFDKTYCYCEGEWFILDSALNGTDAGPWRVNGICFAYGKYYVGDRATNNIGILSENPGEYGNQVEYQLDTFYRGPRGSYLRPKMLEIEILTGQNATTVGLSLSKDGRIKGDYHYRSLGPTGEYQRRVRWRPSGGLGRFESFMGISIRGTGNVKIGAEGIDVS